MMEVNTRGHYKKGLDLYPSLFILEAMQALQIPIVLNSDSHHPDEITAGFSLAAERLLSAGYKTVKVLRLGIWEDVGLTASGYLQCY